MHSIESKKHKQLEEIIMRALIYINKSKKEHINETAEALIAEYCLSKGYDIVDVCCEDTDRTGMSEKTCFMAVGMGVTNHIDVVVTVMAQMVGKTDEQIFTNLHNLDAFGIRVETVFEDLDEYYEELHEMVEVEEARAVSLEEFFNYIANVCNAGTQQ